MFSKHVDKLIEAYFDDRLSSNARQQIESHIRDCPICARRFFDAKRLERELVPLMQAALGRPAPRPMLRQEIRNALKAKQAARPFYLGWTTPVRFLNAIGTVATLLLLAFGVFVAVQSQTQNTASLSNITSLRANDSSESLVQATPTPTPFLFRETISATPRREHASLNDILPTPTPLPSLPKTGHTPNSITSLEVDDKIKTALSSQMEPDVDAALQQIATPSLPGGTIAYALFNPTPGRQLYEIHFVGPDGVNHRQFPLGGVSEPALHPTNSDGHLAFRAWNGPTSPRSLLSGDLPNQQFKSITNFWEDAQPDWSPLENRIIFASQRESDRRWRLYTVWGDGSAETNLRREGKSPTFAPDGYRFAFESCDDNGNRCGLWLGDLEHSEYGSKLFLADPLAKSPDWSPVSEEIAYMTNPNSNWDLYLTNSDGSNVRRLTDDPAIDGLPAWSPDGKWLAFVSDRGEGWGIWLLHISSGKLHHVITFENGTLTSPNYQPYNQHGQRYWWDEQLSWGP